jgi:oligopeptide transport system substrate-binding protein
VELGGFQPELARALLAEAGYPRGRGFPVISLLFNTSDSHKQVAEVLQQQWKDVLGVQIGLENQEWKVFMVSTQRREYDIARGGWIGDYLDPNTFLDLWTSSNANNRTGFSSPAYDALIAEAARVVDGARRMELLRRCESIITQEECIILPIYFYVVTNMYDGGRWGGLEPNLINSIDLKSIYRRGES